MYFEDNSMKYSAETNELFRKWGKKVHECFEGIGLVQTADTSQINWETIETPGTVSTNAGYEVWRFNDEAQTEHPIFMKVFYGKAASAARPRLSVQFGTGSNGSGTLTNPSTETVLTNAGEPGEKGLIQAVLKDGELFFIHQHLTTSATVCAVFWVSRLKHPVTKAALGSWAYGAAVTTASVVTTGQLWTSSWAAWSANVGSPSPLSNEIVIPGVVNILGSVSSAPFQSFCLLSSTAVPAGEEGEIEINNVSQKYKTTIGSMTGMERSVGNAVGSRIAILKA